MFCCKNKGGFEARVVGGALIVSLTDNGLPRVWRGDLSHAASAVLEVQEQQGKFSLVLKSADKTESIAVFPAKDEAARAMRVVTDALLRGAAAPGQGGHAGTLRGLFGKILRFVFWLMALVAVLVVTLFALAPGKGGEPDLQRVQVPQVRTGVPVPAEDMFGR